MTRPNYGRVAPGLRRTIGAPARAQDGLSAGSVPEPGTARIAVDLLGGDHAPAVVVDGALRACQADPALHLLLVGPVEAAGAVLAALGPAERERVSSMAAPAERADLVRAAPLAERDALARRERIARESRDRAAPGDGRLEHDRREVATGGRRPRSAEGWVESGVRTAVLAVAQGLADGV
ncbi:MAG: phosphate acyltransferase, partial [Actinoplanes sp.]|nr:phosphate acyltransferase [Actinoplanes sp.]